MKWTGENASPYVLSMPWPMGAASAVLMLSLAACSGKSSNSKEPSNLDEADEQKKAPNDLIEQAMEKSEESKRGAFAPANAPPSLYRKFFVFGLGGRPHVVSGMFHSHPHGICRFVSAGNRQNESYYITGILPCQHLILPGIINQQPNAVI